MKMNIQEAFDMLKQSPECKVVKEALVMKTKVSPAFQKEREEFEAFLAERGMLHDEEEY